MNFSEKFSSSEVQKPLPLGEWLGSTPVEAKIFVGVISLLAVAILVSAMRMAHFNGVVDGVFKERRRTGRWN